MSVFLPSPFTACRCLNPAVICIRCSVSVLLCVRTMIMLRQFKSRLWGDGMNKAVLSVYLLQGQVFFSSTADKFCNLFFHMISWFFFSLDCISTNKSTLCNSLMPLCICCIQLNTFAAAFCSYKIVWVFFFFSFYNVLEGN